MDKGLTEEEVKESIKSYLKKTGWFDFHLKAGKWTYKGAPDRISIKSGVVLFVEIKREKGGKQSEDQMKFENDCRSHGGHYVLVNSVECLIEYLGKHFPQLF